MPRNSLARRVVLGGLLGALLVVCKEVLAPLPGIEPVTPLVIFNALELPALGPWAIAVFVILQFLLYGFGLCFGALFTPVYFLTQGPGGALAWWAAGIPTDIAHCLGNFAVMLVLYRPLRPLFHRLGRQ